MRPLLRHRPVLTEQRRRAIQEFLTSRLWAYCCLFRYCVLSKPMILSYPSVFFGHLTSEVAIGVLQQVLWSVEGVDSATNMPLFSILAVVWQMFALVETGSGWRSQQFHSRQPRRAVAQHLPGRSYCRQDMMPGECMQCMAVMWRGPCLAMYLQTTLTCALSRNSTDVCGCRIRRTHVVRVFRTAPRRRSDCSPWCSRHRCRTCYVGCCCR